MRGSLIKKGLNKEEIDKRISEYLYLIDNEYLGSNYKHNWKCKCGNEFEQKFLKIQPYIKAYGYYKCRKCRPSNKNRFETKTNEWSNEDIEYLVWAINKKEESLPNICIWLEKSEMIVQRKIHSLRKNGMINSRLKGDKYHCIECGEYKDISDFFVDSSSKNIANPLGLEQRCKVCDAKLYPIRNSSKLYVLNDYNEYTKEDLFGESMVCKCCNVEKNINDFGWMKKSDKKIYKTCNQCRTKNDKKRIEKRMMERGY